MPASTSLDVVATAAVIIERVGHRPDHGVPIRKIRQQGQVLTDQQPRRARGDGLERTTDPVGGMWLEVERLQLAWAAEEEYKNDRLRPGGNPLLFCLQQLRQRQSKQSGSRSLQEWSTTETRRVAATIQISSQLKHCLLHGDRTH